MQRRHFLRSLPLVLSPLIGRAQSSSGSLIIRQKEPENLEFAFATLDSLVTPVDRFYIRSHFAVPQVNASSWRLKVEGAVERPLELSFDELRQLGEQTKMATLECAGNSRVFLVPAAQGVQWELGAVSNAEWAGVPLAAVLRRAGVRSNAVEVVLQGADSGEIRTDPHPPGPIHFARSLSLAKAMQGDVLLAHRMNGQPLPLAHGHPVRAVVPGWYGMASVKWLTTIRVVTEPFQGHFQTIDYAYWDRKLQEPSRRPLTEMSIKSAIARPSLREVVRAGASYRVFGAAWTGESEIAKVEVSTNNGQTWQEARLTTPAQRHVWRLWEYEWRAPAQAGQYVLLSRATDARGTTQPVKHDPDFANYQVHHTLPIAVDVR